MLLKRLIDLVASFLGILILSPVLAVVAIAVRLRLGKPILFTQLRPGLHGAPFRMIKFRTMRDSVDSQGHSLADAERLTKLGKFMRSTSLDELPELWNVLMGDMSLVGPRPLLMEYLPLYNSTQAKRHDVRPGITGWAQINGRNAISWPQKFELDVWYVDNRSIGLDLKILLLTIWKVVRRDGISAQGEATIGKFAGNDK